MSRLRARPPRHGACGFTLIEVMVSLLIMAILAAMAFRGIDALVHAKDTALTSTDQTLKLNTGMSQFEYDVSQSIDSKVLPSAIMFDGATLRFARRTPDGIQLVLWTLQDRRWQRWASPPTVQTAQLTEAWMRSQQWGAVSGDAVTVLDNVDDFQVYLCNPAAVATSGCSWNNVQSTQGATPATPPPSTASGTPGAPPVTAVPVVAQPNGIRITLKLSDGQIMRERELPRWGAT
jgi:general secretion pathway protein J